MTLVGGLSAKMTNSLVVPQGSIIGPLLILLYLDDLPLSEKDANVTLLDNNCCEWWFPRCNSAEAIWVTAPDKQVVCSKCFWRVVSLQPRAIRIKTSSSD